MPGETCWADGFDGGAESAPGQVRVAVDVGDIEGDIDDDDRGERVGLGVGGGDEVARLVAGHDGVREFLIGAGDGKLTDIDGVDFRFADGCVEFDADDVVAGFAGIVARVGDGGGHR